MRLEPVDEAVRPEDRRWQEMADELQFSALAYTREAAERWTRTIGSITGAFGLLALFAGPASLARSTPTTRLSLGALLLSAIVLGVASTLLAALAAQGTPKLVLTGYAAFRAEYRRQLREGSRNLRRSRLLSLLAVLPLVVAIAVSWYGSRPDPAVVSITRAGQPEVCIHLSPDASELEVAADTKVTVRLRSSCPP